MIAIRRPAAGFTLVELLITIGVLGILAALAGPALRTMATSQQVRTAAYDMYSTLTHARSEALTRNATVTVAPVDGNWAHGWTVTEAGGTVLRRQGSYPRVTLSGPASVIFSGEGRPSSVAVPFGLSAASMSEESWRCVRLRLNGRSTLLRGECP